MRQKDRAKMREEKRFALDRIGPRVRLAMGKQRKTNPRL